MNTIKLFYLLKRGSILIFIRDILYMDIDKDGLYIVHCRGGMCYRCIFSFAKVMRDNVGCGLLMNTRGEFINTNHIHKRRKFKVEEIILIDGSSHYVCRALIRIMEKPGKQSYTEMKIKIVKPKHR